MNALQSYALTTLAWNLTQALPLLIWPQAIISLLSDSNSTLTTTTINPPSSSSLEIYLARSLALALIALGGASLVSAGGLEDSSSSTTPPKNLTALLLVTTLHQAATAFYAWALWGGSRDGGTGFLLGSLGSAATAAYGVWCLLFGDGEGRISRRTGRDKRTSGLLFGGRKEKGKGSGKGE
ncbi:hypothetical protein F4778DRAFT_86270 [Xylariomycetidae sp. FL2044]|nr:hypothetical protein F4778DRAFT_86270 [Xylariomycetidae sp. FL2044]